ncbi:MAG TPA: S-layer homology domain-containing protein [Chloroflexia bacterium]|nr:S-layer homology domain-containing protein [Chloroflexia bacterium]
MTAQTRYALSQKPAPSRPSDFSAQHNLIAPAFIMAAVTFCLLAFTPAQGARAAEREASAPHDKGAPSTSLSNLGSTSCTGWDIVESATNSVGRLHGVSALTPDDVWAVGNRWEATDGSSYGRTLIEHWDGSTWSVVPSPNGGTHQYTTSFLVDVAAIAPDDAWAIGYWSDYIGGSNYPLALHWDGVTWSSVETNYYMGDQYTPTAITAISSDDVWVVGRHGNYQTWTMHWDGETWSMVASPSPGPSYNYLSSVSGSASNDVWAVGITQPGDTIEPLLIHWDGSSWQEMPYPDAAAGLSLRAVKAFAPDDVWVVGTSYDFLQSTYTPISMHYDGAAWSVDLLPAQPDFSQIHLADLDGSGPTDLWAVGSKRGVSAALVLTYHWDGSSWSTVYSPTPRSDEDGNLSILSVTSAGPDHTWLVGYQTDGAVVEKRGDPTTACSIDYADVPSDNTFHPYVRCLSCRTVLSGYPCGGAGEPCNPQNEPYFRPNANITRGQLSKIISNAAQFASMPGRREFEDVSSANTFYVWVQNLASRGFIAGYPCGGEGEPCVSPRNRPYFRPNATATRGQIAKIVSNSLRLTDDLGARRFEDVPESNVFYPYVQRLANRGAMGGYPCGTEGEPCVQPTNRPYFRPNNNATRGQLSKIVNISFYTLPALSQFDNRP